MRAGGSGNPVRAGDPGLSGASNAQVQKTHASLAFFELVNCGYPTPPPHPPTPRGTYFKGDLL